MNMCRLMYVQIAIQNIKNYHIVLFVLALVSVDVVILFTYTILEGIQDNLAPIKTANAENPSEIHGVSTCMHHLNSETTCSAPHYEYHTPLSHFCHMLCH